MALHLLVLMLVGSAVACGHTEPTRIAARAVRTCEAIKSYDANVTPALAAQQSTDESQLVRERMTVVAQQTILVLKVVEHEAPTAVRSEATLLREFWQRVQSDGLASGGQTQSEDHAVAVVDDWIRAQCGDGFFTRSQRP